MLLTLVKYKTKDEYGEEEGNRLLVWNSYYLSGISIGQGMILEGEKKEGGKDGELWVTSDIRSIQLDKELLEVETTLANYQFLFINHVEREALTE